MALLAAYKERYGNKTLLAFSRGKDSNAVALALRDKINVIPLHHDDLPGLEFVEESLAYYERQLFNRAAPAALACAAKLGVTTVQREPHGIGKACNSVE